MTARGKAGLAVLLVVGVALAVVSAFYLGDVGAARTRVATGARIAQTACGPVQYAESGQGIPMLVIHGAGGGFDQGLDFFSELPRHGVRIIAMSRFGYLDTPMPPDVTAPAQARAHACLLDALGIPRAAIAGGSAGAPSATQFAILFPERTTHLVLLVPALYVPRPGGAQPITTPEGTQFLFDTALRSDFLLWLAIRAAPRTVMRALLATPPEVVEAADARERERVARVMEHILPVAPRRLGLLNDAKVTSTQGRYELERIRAPTLIVTARDDLFGTYDIARYTASQIPGARLVAHDKGGHLLVGHTAAHTAAIAGFLGAAVSPQ